MNARDWDSFNEAHSDDVWVSSPDAPKPTENKSDHMGEGDYICAVHENGGAFTEPWHLPGTNVVIPPNGEKYSMTMVTMAKSNGKELTEKCIIL